MDQPTGDQAPEPEAAKEEAAPEPAPAAAPRAQASEGPNPRQKQLLIGGGVGLALLLGVGFFIEGRGEVGKVEKIAVDESDFGKLKSRTLREIGSFEAALSTMESDTASQIRPTLQAARDVANAATTADEIEKARAMLQKVRVLAGPSVK
jgi:hypothetical protein